MDPRYDALSQHDDMNESVFAEQERPHISFRNRGVHLCAVESQVYPGFNSKQKSTTGIFHC